jgi:hypothetical protein
LYLGIRIELSQGRAFIKTRRIGELKILSELLIHPLKALVYFLGTLQMAIRGFFSGGRFIEAPDFCAGVGGSEDVAEGVELMGAVCYGFGMGAFASFRPAHGQR